MFVGLCDSDRDWHVTLNFLMNFDLEEELSPQELMAKAVMVAQQTLKEREQRIQELSDETAKQKQMLTEFEPKVSYYDIVLQTPDVISISKIAKDYGKSPQWLNQLLHDKGIQYKQGNIWILYQKHAEQGYTKSKTELYIGYDGEQHSKLHTYWTQKGRLFIYDTLKSDGILPLIERQ